MSTSDTPRWVLIAENWHVIVSWGRDKSWRFGRSACGWLLSHSPHDRKPDAPVCGACSSHHPDLTVPRRRPDPRRGTVAHSETE